MSWALTFAPKTLVATILIAALANSGCAGGKSDGKAKSHRDPSGGLMLTSKLSLRQVQVTRLTRMPALVKSDDSQAVQYANGLVQSPHSARQGRRDAERRKRQDRGPQGWPNDKILDSKRSDCQDRLYRYSMNSLASGLKTNLLVYLDTKAQQRFDCVDSNELSGRDVVITAQCTPQRLKKNFAEDGLGEVNVETAAESLVALARQCVRGQGDDRSRIPLASQCLYGLIAVHGRHLNVEHDDVVEFSKGPIDGIPPVLD